MNKENYTSTPRDDDENDADLSWNAPELSEATWTALLADMFPTSNMFAASVCATQSLTTSASSSEYPAFDIATNVPPMTMMGSTSQRPDRIATPTQLQTDLEHPTCSPPRDTPTSSETTQQHIPVATSSYPQTTSGSSSNYCPRMPPPSHVPATMSSSTYRPAIMSPIPFFQNPPEMSLPSSPIRHAELNGLGLCHYFTPSPATNAQASSSRLSTEPASPDVTTSWPLPTEPNTEEHRTEAQGTKEDSRGRGKRRDKERDFMHEIKVITNKYSPGIYFPPQGGKEKDRVEMVKKVLEGVTVMDNSLTESREHLKQMKDRLKQTEEERDSWKREVHMLRALFQLDGGRNLSLSGQVNEVMPDHGLSSYVPHSNLSSLSSPIRLLDTSSVLEEQESFEAPVQRIRGNDDGTMSQASTSNQLLDICTVDEVHSGITDEIVQQGESYLLHYHVSGDDSQIHSSANPNGLSFAGPSRQDAQREYSGSVIRPSHVQKSFNPYRRTPLSIGQQRHNDMGNENVPLQSQSTKPRPSRKGKERERCSPGPW